VVGRDSELAILRGLLNAAQQGHGGGLVVYGEPGIGRSTLLDTAAEIGQGMMVLRCAGVESETELAFAGLHQLTWPLVDRLDSIPATQATALRGAIGLGEPSGDRLLVGIALLTLLAVVAEERPVLVLVDDAQWLDAPSADALVFVGRRLKMESIAMLFAARTGALHEFGAPGLPEMTLERLPDEAAAELLKTLDPDVAPLVRQRLVSESEGNPLAVIELSKLLSPDERHGRDDLPNQLPLSSRLQHAYLDRVHRLPDATQRLLLVAAADPSSDISAVLPAGRAMNIGMEAIGPAEEAGLIVTDDRKIRFRHPLVRSAIYGGANFNERVAAHRALAEVADEEALQAWHLAAATIGHDEDVAAALERSAERAEARSGPAAAAAMLERAAALSPKEVDRSRRLVHAASAAFKAGQLPRTHHLLDEAEQIERSPDVQAHLHLTRGLTYAQSATVDTATVTFLQGAGEVSSLAPEGAALLLAAAASSAWYTDEEARLDEVWKAIKALPVADDALPKRLAASLSGPTIHRTVELPGGLFQASLEAHAQLPISPWAWPSPIGVNMAGDLFTAHRLYRRLAAGLRASGAVGQLAQAWTMLAIVELFIGHWSDAAMHASEVDQLRETGDVASTASALAVLSRIAGAQGRADECRRLAAEAVRLGTDRGAIAVVAAAGWSLAGLETSEGRCEEAFLHLDPGARSDRWPDGSLVAPSFAADLVDVCWRTGRTATAERVVETMESWVRGHAPPWAHVAAHRGRALLSTGERALDEFGAAASVSGGDEHPFELAQTRLLYGESLRRQRYKTEARRQLRAAIEVFTELGARPWAERGQAELRATGISVANRRPGPSEQLTPQELQIARLCARGMSNRDIGGQLFLSPRTVGFHLSNVFAKLGIASRNELRGMKLEEPSLVF
jgi:DNA-binding CsgD family transcriptional regulator